MPDNLLNTKANRNFLNFKLTADIRKFTLALSFLLSLVFFLPVLAQEGHIGNNFQKTVANESAREQLKSAKKPQGTTKPNSAELEISNGDINSENTDRDLANNSNISSHKTTNSSVDTESTPLAFSKEIKNEFESIQILAEGRIKPLSTYAKATLLRYSGKSKAGKLSASEWLFRSLLDARSVSELKIFLINNPESAEAINLVPDKHRKYSFKELYTNIEKLNEQANVAFSKTKEDRSVIDQELIRTFINFHHYNQLTQSLALFKKQRFLYTNSKNLAEVLGEPPYSAFNLIQQAQKIAREINNEVNSKASAQLTALLMSYLESYREYQSTFKQENLLNIITYQQDFLTPWQYFYKREDINKLNVDPRSLMDSLHNLVQAYSFNDSETFLAQLKSFNTLTYKQNRIASHKLLLEKIYNSFNFLFYAKFLYILCFLTALFAVSTNSISNTGKRSIQWWTTNLASTLMYVAVILHSFALISRILILERAPVSNLFETFMFVAWVTAILGLVIELVERRKQIAKPIGHLVGSIAAFILLMIAAKFAAEGDTMKVLIAVLNSNFWLSTHVIAEMIGYAGVSLAGVIGHIYLIKMLALNNIDTGYKNIAHDVNSNEENDAEALNKQSEHESNKDKLTETDKATNLKAQTDKTKQHKQIDNKQINSDPIDKQVDLQAELKYLINMTIGMMAFGLLFTFLGTMLGGIWADQSWGRFWGWDPKENGALLIILWVAITLHARLMKVIKDRGTAIASIIGTMVVMLSWFGVNLLGVGLHSYGFTSGIGISLATYFALELIFVAVILVLQKRRAG
jgi:cytochrome c-type biogenesis protein CcsB